MSISSIPAETFTLLEITTPLSLKGEGWSPVGSFLGTLYTQSQQELQMAEGRKQARVSSETSGKKSSRRSTSLEVEHHKLPGDSAHRGRRKSATSKYPCEICGQLYSRLDNLRVHKRMHSGEMPFKCKFCGQPFRWLGALRSHEGSHMRNSNFTGNTRDRNRSSGGSDQSKPPTQSTGASSSRGNPKHHGDRKKDNHRASSTRSERSHGLPSMITLSEVDPGIRDFGQTPWHNILDD